MPGCLAGLAIESLDVSSNKLQTLDVQGTLSESVVNLRALHNALAAVSIEMPGLKDCDLSFNTLEKLELVAAKLTFLQLEGNKLQVLAPSVLQCPLSELCLRGNPIDRAALEADSASARPKLN